LVDGKRGATGAFGEDWLGFEGKDVEAIVDLGKIRSFTTITAGFLSDQPRWVFLPAAVEFAVGTKQENMRAVFSKNYSTERVGQPTVKDITAKIASTSARYVRVRAKTIGTCPPWHPGAGAKAWLFLDEIMVH
jgi:hexosaminidase